MFNKKRSKVYVDKIVQGALARRIIMHWFLFFAAIMVSLTALQYFLGDPNSSFTEHMGAIWGDYSFFILLMFAMVPVFVWDTLKVSHRFAGPMLRLRTEMKNLANGDQVGELKFRDNDFWLELSDDFNKVAKKVGEDQETQEV